MIWNLSEQRDRYEEAVLNAAPLASYARLHLITPVALLAAVACALLGLLLPQGRHPEVASRLIEPGPARHAYDAGLKRYRQHRSHEVRSGAQSPSGVSEVDAAQQRRLIALARGEQLDHCQWRSGFLTARGQVVCEGRRLRDQALVASFWFLMACCAIAFFSWLYIQFRDSWMLPHWSPRLWYTPIYAALIGLVFCGPFLMVAVYHARADASYAVPAREWAVGQPGMLLLVLAVLQVTAIVVASIDRRPRATHFAAGTGVLVVVALGIYVLLEQTLRESRGGQTIDLLATSQLLIIAIALAVRFIWSFQLLRRTAALSAVLAIAWGLIALGGVLEEIGLQNAVIESGIDTLCYLAVAVHLWSSRFSELELWRLGAD